MTEIIRLIDDNREFKCMINKHLEEYNKSQVLALQKQINPHFLNNVLSMISYKIVESGGMQSQALNMIVMLTRIIRYGFNNDTYMVLLREEAGFISDYIKILKEQYGDFQFEMNISDEAYEQKVLRLSIQPFIENAAYHGIHDLKADGKVSLSGEIINERLISIVEDNGVGIDEQRLAALNNIDDNTVDYSHIGIYNTYRRMKAVYADDVKLKFESDSKSFTRVTIDLPIKK